MDTLAMVSLLINVFLAGWTLGGRNQIGLKIASKIWTQKKEMWETMLG